LYPAENAVADLLARAYRSQNDEDSREPTPIPSPSTEDRQQRALVRMSADLLSERQRREKLEEDKYELEGALTQIKRDMKLRNTLIADGLETAQPDEIASKFSKSDLRNYLLVLECYINTAGNSQHIFSFRNIG